MASEHRDSADSGHALLVVAGALALLPFGLWAVAHTAIATAAVALLKVELLVAPPLFDYPAAAAFIARHAPSAMNFTQVELLVSMAARPFLPVALLLGWRWWRRTERADVGKIYRRKIGLEELIRIQAEQFPYILPIVGDDPLKDKTGRWDIQERPELWLRRHGIPEEMNGLHLAEAGQLLAEARLDHRAIELQYRPLPPAASGAADADFAREALRGALPHLFHPDPDDPARPEKAAAAIALSWRMLDAFAGQLGRRWSGPHALTWHERALFTVFALKMAQSNEKADALVRRLATLWRAVPLAPQPGQRAPYPEHWHRRAENERVMRARFDGLISRDETLAAAIAEILADRGGTLRPALRIGGMHGYEASAMISLYACAKRRSGVFPSAQFLWLKLCNRTLWYALNSHGRRTPHPEGAGSIAHWRAECAFGRALADPYLCEAVRGMFDYYASNRRQAVSGAAVPAWAQDDFSRAEA